MNDLIYKLRLYGPGKFIQFLSAEAMMRLRNIVSGSYSQCGEDLLLSKMFESYPAGFYVDIGAYDPIRFSNTYRFYRKGWSGINVEPNFEQFRKFETLRTRDINLNIGAGISNEKLTYYQMIPPTLSTFSKDMAKDYKQRGFICKATKKIPVLRLKNIFSKYLKGRDIQFISIDVEGYEMDVLKSNDWKMYRPMVICLEMHFGENFNSQVGAREKLITEYLEKNGYRYVRKTELNYFFIDQKRKGMHVSL